MPQTLLWCELHSSCCCNLVCILSASTICSALHWELSCSLSDHCSCTSLPHVEIAVVSSMHSAGFFVFSCLGYLFSIFYKNKRKESGWKHLMNYSIMRLAIIKSGLRMSTRLEGREFWHEGKGWVVIRETVKISLKSEKIMSGGMLWHPQCEGHSVVHASSSNICYGQVEHQHLCCLTIKCKQQ